MGTKLLEMEQLINKLKGVRSSKICMEEDVITELHVLTDSSRNPKQTVRDVQSALLSVYDLELDHKVISVAQLDFIDDAFIRNRIKIEAVSFKSLGRLVQADVTLSYGEKLVTASTEIPNILNARYKACAISTIKAVEELLGFDQLFFFDTFQIINLGDHEIILVVLATFFGNREEVLTGTSRVTDDKYVTVVKAVLDSINRKIKLV